MTASLIERLEAYLGPIDAGWSRDEKGDIQLFQVAPCTGSGITSAVAFSTLGLSKFELASRRTGRNMRHELLMLVPDFLRDGTVPGLLQQIGREALTAGRPYLRGDVIGPRGTMFPRSELTALYVALPVYFPDHFAMVEENGAMLAKSDDSLVPRRATRRRRWLPP